MKTKKIAGGFILLLIITSFISITVSAAESDKDIKIFNLELEKMVSLLNAWIALFLFILAFIAYKRDKRKRLLYVGIAFLLFSIKSFLLSSELIFPEIPWRDPIATALEFLVLLSFFFGVLRR